MKSQSVFQRFYHGSLLRVAKREMHRIADSWVLLFVTLVGPVSVFLLVSWMFSTAVVRELPVVVVDMDHSQLSSKVIRMIDATPAALVVGQLLSLEEGRSAMQRGEADAVIYLPKDLEKSVLTGMQSKLALYVNNSNVVIGGVLQSQLYTTLSTLSVSVKVGTQLKKGLPPEQAIAKSTPLKADTHLLFNPFGNYAYFLLMGLLPLLAVVFIFLGTAYAIGMEMKDGSSPEWMDAAENSMTVAIVGKLLPYLFLFFFNMMVMNILLINVMSIPLNGSLAAILFSELLLILAYQGVALLILTVTANVRLTLSLGSAYTMMALTFSGLTFPSMGMPLVAKMFACIFPYTFWLKVFLSQSLRGEPIHEIILPVLLLLPFILLGVLSIPAFKRRLKDPKWQLRD